MPILTAEEFKERLRTTHHVSNAIVKEPIVIDFRDGGQFTGDLVIQNCKLASLRISQNQFDSLTIQKGAIKELIFQTSAQIQRVTITKCDIQTITTTETLIEEFTYITGILKTVITGQFAGLTKLSISGIVKSLNFINPNCSIVQFTNFQAAEVNMISLAQGDLLCKNVVCNKININYGSNTHNNISLTNVSSKDFQLTSENVRSLKYKGDIKYLTMGTTLTP